MLYAMDVVVDRLYCLHVQILQVRLVHDLGAQYHPLTQTRMVWGWLRLRLKSRVMEMEAEM